METQCILYGLLLALTIIQTNAKTFAQQGDICIKTHGGSPCIKTTSEGLPTSLVCINAKCQCESFRHHIFNKDLKICQSKVGGFCTNATEYSCMKHSICDTSLGESNGICICKKGMLPNKGGRCVGQYGSHCSMNSHCPSKLVCREEICSCPESLLQTYHPYLSVCQSVVGAMCGPTESCIDGAICQSENDTSDEFSFKTCQCREGYRQVGRKCIENLYFILRKIPAV